MGFLSTRTCCWEGGVSQNGLGTTRFLSNHFCTGSCHGCPFAALFSDAQDAPAANGQNQRYKLVIGWGVWSYTTILSPRMGRGPGSHRKPRQDWFQGLQCAGRSSIRDTPYTCSSIVVPAACLAHAGQGIAADVP